MDGWSADLLCSRNARPEKALVGRAQWEINRPPVLGKESLRSFGGEEGGGWSSRGLCSRSPERGERIKCSFDKHGLEELEYLSGYVV
jgi:hypothetical protein